MGIEGYTYMTEKLRNGQKYFWTNRYTNDQMEIPPKKLKKRHEWAHKRKAEKVKNCQNWLKTDKVNQKDTIICIKLFINCRETTRLAYKVKRSKSRVKCSETDKDVQESIEMYKTDLFF